MAKRKTIGEKIAERCITMTPGVASMRFETKSYLLSDGKFANYRSAGRVQRGMRRELAEMIDAEIAKSGRKR